MKNKILLSIEKNIIEREEMLDYNYKKIFSKKIMMENIRMFSKINFKAKSQNGNLL